MSNPVSILGGDPNTPQWRQQLQDALDTLYGLIQKAGGTAAGPTTFDELRVRMLTVLGTIDVVPEDKPPANVNSRLVTPWLTGQRGRGQVWRFEDQQDGGNLLEVRSQPYLIGTPTATAGDWEFRFYSAQRDPAGAYRSLGAIRFGSDGRIRTYDASEVLLFDSSLALTSSTVPLPTRHVSGLVIRYASATTITVSAGKARDKADGANMTLAAQVTVDKASANAALGYERKTLTGTHTLNFGTGVVTGTGSAYLTEFGTRALSVGTVTNAATTLTGTSTKFLSEVAVNDLIGNTTSGYFRVASVESDTSLTLEGYPSAFGPPCTGVDFSGAIVNVIEQPVIESAAGKAAGLVHLYTNTNILLRFATGSATETGVAAYASSKSVMDSSSYTCLWRAVWLLSGGSGTTVALSTQRTTPYLSITGYTTSYRRIGWVRVDSSGNLLYVKAEDAGPTRFVAVTNTLVVTNAASTNTDTVAQANTVAPPTTTMLQATLQSEAPNSVQSVYAGAAGSGADLYVAAPSTSLGAFNTGMLNCDGAQRVYHGAPATTTDGTYLYITGYWDVLE